MRKNGKQTLIPEILRGGVLFSQIVMKNFPSIAREKLGDSLGRGGGEAVNQVALYSLTLWYGLKSKLTYRLSSVFELLGKFLEIFAQILIWVALLGSGARFDTTLSQMVTYLILTRVVSTLFATQAGNEISDKIDDGSIANDFVRPLNFKLYLLCNDLGNNFFKVLVVFLPIGVLAGLRYGFLLPQTAAQGAAFLVSLAFGALLTFYYSYLLGLLSFWLIKNPFLRWHFRNVEQIFSGQFFPIWLYPAWLSAITEFLPFRYFTYEPLAIYLGKTPASEIPRVLLIQAFWLVALYAVERILWRRACKRVLVQGG